MRLLLKLPDYRRFLLASATSGIGDTMLLVVLGVIVQEVTGSASAAGLVALFMLLPGLTGPVLGAVADHTSGRRVIIVVSAVMALLVMAVPLATSTGAWPLLYAVAAAYGVAFSLLGSAQAGLLPSLVPPPQLGRANALIQTFSEGGRLFGPGLGGILFTRVGAGAVAGLDAVTFAVAALLIGRVHEASFGGHLHLDAGAVEAADHLNAWSETAGASLVITEIPPASSEDEGSGAKNSPGEEASSSEAGDNPGKLGEQGASSESSARGWGQVLAGIPHLLTTPGLASLMAGVVVAFATIGFLETAIFAVATTGLGRPASFVAVFAVAQGLCAIPAGLVAGAVLDRAGAVRTCAVGLGVFALSAAVFLLPWAATAVAAAGIGAVGMTWFFIAFSTAVQERTPSHMQGRAAGSASAALTCAQVIAVATGAAVATAVDYRWLLATIIVGCLAGAIIIVRGGRLPTPSFIP